MKKSFRVLAMMMAGFLVFSCGDSNENLDYINPKAEEILNEKPEPELSFDWAGTFEGTIPCADCEGIHITVNLQNDLMYTLSETYKGKGDSTFEDEGMIEWDEANEKLILISMMEARKLFFSYEGNSIVWLDLEGNKIEGELADLYVLKRK